MVQKFDDAKIIKPGDVPGQTDSSGADSGEAGRYYTRMQYKERQFLRAKDFMAEQDYHIEKMRDHNKALHTYGVCESEAGGVEGLQVSIAPGAQYAKCVVVSKGMAIDRLGNTILLTQNEILDLSSSCVLGNAYTTNVYLYIAYGEANASDPEFNLDEGGFSGCTRLVEKPKFKVSATSDANTDPRYLLLASITRDTAGKIVSFNNKPLGRETAGVKMSQVGSVAIADGAVQSKHLAPNAAAENVNSSSVTISGAKLTDGSVAGAKLSANAAASNINNTSSTTTIDGAKLTNSTVAGAKLANNAAADNINNTNSTTTITGAKLTDSTVTGNKLAANAAAGNINSVNSTATIDGSKISDRSIAGGKLSGSAAAVNINDTNSTTTFTGAKLTDATVTSAKLANNAAATNINSAGSTTTINGAKIADNSVNGSKLVASSVAASKLNIITSVVQVSLAHNVSPATMIRTLLSKDISVNDINKPMGVTYYSNSADTYIPIFYGRIPASSQDLAFLFYYYHKVDNSTYRVVVMGVNVSGTTRSGHLVYWCIQ